MNILVLNGSPHARGNTDFLVKAFRAGAEASGNQVTVLNIARMKIAGCLGCDYCRRQGHGTCIQKDDQEKVYEAMTRADMLVLASPIYYFMMSSYIEAALQRMHATGMRGNIQKTALILSSGADHVYDAAVKQYHMIFQNYMGLDDAGVHTAHGMQNKSDEKQRELMDFGKRL